MSAAAETTYPGTQAGTGTDAPGHLRAFREMIEQLVRHRRLTWELAKREVQDRYIGQVFGMMWTIGHPLALMGIYIFVFGYVFRVKVGGTRELPMDFTVYMLAGLIPWLTFQEAMAKGVSVITGNGNLVKQVVFPLEVLPIKGILSSMLTQVITTSILLAYVLAVFKTLPWTYSLLPVLWLFQLLAMGGICYLFGAVGPYFRDLKDFVQLFCMIGIYAMPIIYLPKWVPTIFKPFLYINPFSYMVWCYQDVCYFGRIEHPWAWPVFCLGSLLLFYGGYRFFCRLRVGFGSVL